MLIPFIYKSARRIFGAVSGVIDHYRAAWMLLGNNVQYANFATTGVPYVMVAIGGRCTIGRNFKMNNGIKGNPIGSYRRCTLVVDRGATLKIGANVGISQAAIICYSSITIDDDVKIGGGAAIYDTDFHSLDPDIRKSNRDLNHRSNAAVHIGENAFIGANAVILKGVTIGKNSIVGAGSVVTKNIPDNEIWGGNPAKFIRAV